DSAGSRQIPHLSSLAACPSSGDGWSYDSASAPQRVQLCASTCAGVAADSSSQVDLLTGCPTQ
ncbi:MAG TPA: hypothetical protein VK898_08005, partial [Chloroflexota bacterium]|nr:hypothetical protein [Chloroflexota bacterium]